MNLGRSGATAQRQTDRPYRETEEYTELLASDYDLAIITLGTNDAKRAFWDEARYAAEYVALIDAVRAANPKGEIALGLPVARGVESNVCHRQISNVLSRRCPRKATKASGTSFEDRSRPARLAPTPRRAAFLVAAAARRQKVANRAPLRLKLVAADCRNRLKAVKIASLRPPRARLDQSTGHV